MAGELAGFVLAYRLPRLDGEAAQLFVYELGVTSQYWHGGIGTSLMGYVRELVDEESLMEAFVLADQRNDAAVRLYQPGACRLGRRVVVFPSHVTLAWRAYGAGRALADATLESAPSHEDCECFTPVAAFHRETSRCTASVNRTCRLWAALTSS